MVFTRRPASLLWRFIIWRALSRVPAISFDSLSRISMKFWANLDYQHITIFLKLPLSQLTCIHTRCCLHSRPRSRLTWGHWASWLPSSRSWRAGHPGSRGTLSAPRPHWPRRGRRRPPLRLKQRRRSLWDGEDGDINIRQHGMLSERGELVGKVEFLIINLRLKKDELILINPF